MKWQREKNVHYYFPIVNMDKMGMRKLEDQVHLVSTFTNVGWMTFSLFVPMLLDYIKDCQYGVNTKKFSL